jgi:predicted  nucleic acid-binding Zn-ribbon protein
MTPPVGADIEALCSKCGDVWHVIEAKVGDDIVRVLCKECGKQHRYKNPKKAAAAAAPKRASTAKPRAPRADKVVERFATPAVAADLSRAIRPYKATELFAPGDRVDHPTFGQGVVEVSEPGKVTMFFATGRKVLAQAKGAPGKLARPRAFDHTGVGLPAPKHLPNAPVADDSDDEDADADADAGN